MSCKATEWLYWRACGPGECIFPLRTRPIDPLVVRLVWSVSLWVVSIWAAWITRRWRQPLLALAPAGLLLAGSINYERANALVLVPFLEAALLLMAQTNHARREADWQAAGIDFSEDIRSDLGFWSLIATGLIVLLAAGTPLHLNP